MTDYYKKYIKYKTKYINLKKIMIGGSEWIEQDHTKLINNRSFASYQKVGQEEGKSWHCSVHFKHGNLHCKSNGTTSHGSFTGKDDKTKPDKQQNVTSKLYAYYNDFFNWYLSNPNPRPCSEDGYTSPTWVPPKPPSGTPVWKRPRTDSP